MQWGPALHPLAELLETTVEDFNIVYERECLDHDIETVINVIPHVCDAPPVPLGPLDLPR